MKPNEIQAFLASIKGKTFLVDGEKARVENASLNPVTHRVMITTNKGTNFWYAGNYAFKKVFATPVQPGRFIQSVVQRPTDANTDLKPEPQPEKKPAPVSIVKRVAAAKPAPVRQKRGAPRKPARMRRRNTNHPHLYDRVLAIMDLKGVSIKQLAEIMGMDYKRAWNLLRNCDKRITLHDVTLISAALQVKLPWLVDTEPVSIDRLHLNTIK